ncbi:hypothetical protein EVAR_40704_1 [Eumeta japonica]|uniref:E3 ubiquitin-protein ligase APD1-4 N-terminal domain-containing protein n=1 Tax=Eumeta variegata TaxID=151549 RepID=A0A4C1X6A5_EUMVA|nr:hypothetical protein EVAR_40704_1 [Eumeta japonica]
MKGQPMLSNKRKHVRLKKSMILPDDTLEYWGFYLLRGATVELKACSRYEGSKILVVKGEKILNTCGILENHKDKVDPSLTGNPGVVATIERPAERNYTKLKEFISEDENTAMEQDSIAYEEENELLHIIKPLQNTNSVEPNSFFNRNNGINNQVDVSDIKATHSNLKQRDRRDIKRQSLHNPNTVLDTDLLYPVTQICSQKVHCQACNPNNVPSRSELRNLHKPWIDTKHFHHDSSTLPSSENLLVKFTACIDYRKSLP